MKRSKEDVIMQRIRRTLVHIDRNGFSNAGIQRYGKLLLWSDHDLVVGCHALFKRCSSCLVGKKVYVFLLKSRGYSVRDIAEIIIGSSDEL